MPRRGNAASRRRPAESHRHRVARRHPSSHPKTRLARRLVMRRGPRRDGPRRPFGGARSRGSTRRRDSRVGAAGPLCTGRSRSARGAARSTCWARLYAALARSVASMSSGVTPVKPRAVLRISSCARCHASGRPASDSSSGSTPPSPGGAAMRKRARPRFMYTPAFRNTSARSRFVVSERAGEVSLPVRAVAVSHAWTGRVSRRPGPHREARERESHHGGSHPRRERPGCLRVLRLTTRSPCGAGARARAPTR